MSTNPITTQIDDAANSVLADTVGVLWRGATGTVDPFTKNLQVSQEAQAIQQASVQNGVPTIDAATAQATAQSDVTVTLKTFVDPANGSVGADPSQAIEGLKRSLSTGAGFLKIALIAGAVIAAIYVATPFIMEARRA